MKQLSLFEECRKNRMTKQFACLLFGIAAFYAVVCTPVFIWAVSDILIAESVFPLIWDAVMLICNYAFYWIAFAYAFYMFFRFETRRCGAILGIYGCVVTFRYVANLIAGYVVTGFADGISKVWDDLPYMLLDILFDCVLMGLFVWIVYVKQRNYTYQTGQHSSVFLRSNLPYDSFFQKDNPALRIPLLGAIIPAAVQLISRVIYDLFYGAPSSLVDLLWMIFSYASDFLFFLVGYFVILLMLNRMFFSEEKARLADKGLFSDDPKSK